MKEDIEVYPTLITIKPSNRETKMARPLPKFKQQEKYYVICEDSKSSKTYLNEAFNHHRVRPYIEAVHLGKTDPLGIVRLAIKKSKAYTTVFCVIDRDNHQNFDEAVRLAKTCDNVRLIVSYPCYELWFILHSGYKRKSYRPAGRKSAADQLISDLQSSHALFTAYAKGETTEGLYKSIATKHPELLSAAFKHAKRLLVEAAADDELNPSTELHIVLEVIDSLLAPQTLPVKTANNI